MPFVNESQRFADGGLAGANLVIDPIDPSDPELEFWADLIPAAFRRENIIGSFLANRGSRPESGRQDPSFDPFADIAGYEDEAARGLFTEADSAEEVAALKNRIDQERKDLRDLTSSGAMGLLASVAAGVLDPLLFLPVGGVIAKGAKASFVTKGFLTAGAAVAGVTASEALLHATQMDRTLTESALNITGAAFLGGVLGGAIGLIGRKKLAKLAAQIENDDPAVMMQGGLDLADLKVSAATLTEELEGVANLTGRTARQEAIVPFIGSKLIGRLSPAMQLLIQTRSAVAIAYMTQLIDPPIRFAKEALGQAVGGVNVIRTKGAQADVTIPTGAVGRGKISAAAAEDKSVSAAEEGLQILRDTPHAELEKRGLIGEGTRFPEREGRDPKADAIRDANARLENLRDSQLEAVGRDAEGGSDVVGIFRAGDDVEVMATRNNGQQVLVQSEGAGKAWIPRERFEADPAHPLLDRPADGMTSRTEFEGQPVVVEAQAKPSVEQQMAKDDIGLARALKGMENDFLDYRAAMVGKPMRGPLKHARIFMGDHLRPNQSVSGLDYNHLTFQQYRELVGQAMRQGDQVIDDLEELVSPFIAKTARRFRRKVLEPMLAKTLSSGLLVNGLSKQTAPSYFTRMWNPRKLIDGRDQFQDIATLWLQRENPNMSADDARTGAAVIWRRLTNAPSGRIAYDVDRLKIAGSTQRRAFTIEDDKISQFLEDDVDLVMRHYVRTMSPDTALAETFGDVQMTRVFRDLTDDYEKKFDLVGRKLDGEEQKKSLRALQRQQKRDVANLEAVRDRLRGTFEAPPDPNALSIRWLRGARAVSLLTVGGGFVPSSMSDIMRPVFENGLLRTVRTGIIPLIRSHQTLKLAVAESKRLGFGLEMVLDTRAMAMFDVGSDSARLTRFERGLHSAARKMSIVNLLGPWNQAMKHWAGIVTQARILEMSEFLAKGGKSTRETAKLASERLNKADTDVIAAQFAEHGLKRDGFFIANTHLWDNTPEVQRVLDLYAAAVRAEVDRVIVTPGVGDIPKLMSKESWKNITQYKSFGVAAVSRILVPALQNRDLASLNGFVLSTAMGMGVYAFKQGAAGREVSDDPAVWIREGIDRSGVLGIGGDIFNIADKVNLGPNLLIDGPQSSRYASRNVISSLFGPTLGLGATGVSLLTSISPDGEFKQRNMRELRKLVPYQNIFYWRKLFDMVEEQANESFGVKQ